MQQQKNIQPPHWVQRILEWYCKPEILEDLQGDLNEYFVRNCEKRGVWQARIIYFIDVIRFIRSYTLKKPGRSNGSDLILLRSYYITGIRSLRKYSLNTFLNITGLSLGLVSFFMILLYVEFEYNYDRHDVNSERIFRVTLDVTSNTATETLKLACADAPLAENLRGSFGEIEAVTAIFRNGSKLLVTNGKASFLEQRFYHADGAFFDVFTHRWLYGDSQGALSGPSSIVLTEKIARKYFGEEAPLNKSLLVDSRSYTVTGVIADPPENTDLQFDAILSGEPRDWAFTFILFNSRDQAAAFEPKLDSLLAENIAPGLAPLGYEGRYELEGAGEAHFGEPRFFDPPKGNVHALYIFTAIAILILIISCINFINLNIGQSVRRQAEMGLRTIFGAMRAHIRFQFMVEAFLICGISMTLAFLLIIYVAPLFFPGFQAYREGHTPNNIFLFSMGAAALLVVVLCGSYPASQISGATPVKHLRHQSIHGAFSPDFRRALLFMQFSGSMALIFSASVVVDQMRIVINSDPGFLKDNVVVIDLPRQVAPATLISLKNSIDQFSFVHATSFAGENSTPPDAAYWDTYFIQPENSGAVVKMLNYVRVDENYFETLGISISEGRIFSSDDAQSEEEYVVINEALARSLGWKEALGKKIGYGSADGEKATVIGVVNDFSFQGLHRKAEPMQFYQNHREPQKLLIRLSEASFRTLQSLEDTWKKLFSDEPLSYHLLEDSLMHQLESERRTQRMIITFSVTATIIACLGVFGLINISVSNQMKETSIRKVFGAGVLDVLSLTWSEYLLIFGAASVAGFGIIYLVMSDWLESFPVQTSIGFSNYVTGVIVFGLVLMLTVFYHGMRVKRLNILNSIKSE